MPRSIQNKTIVFFLVLLSLFISVSGTFAAESSTTDKGPTVYVILETNVRSGAGTNFEIIGKLNVGDAISKIGETGKWAIVDYNGKAAYVLRKALTNCDTEPAISVEAKQSVNVRSGPGTSYTIIGVLNRGEKVFQMGTFEKWTEIRYNGNFAYIYSNYVNKTIDKEASDVIDYLYTSIDGLEINIGKAIVILDIGERLKYLGEAESWYKVEWENSALYIQKELLTTVDIRNSTIKTSDKQFATLDRTSRIYSDSQATNSIYFMQSYKVPQRVMIIEDLGKVKKIAVFGYEVYVFNYDLSNYSSNYEKSRDDLALYNYELAKFGKEYRTKLKSNEYYGGFGYDNAENKCVLYFKKGSNPKINLESGFKIGECKFSIIELERGINEVHRIAKSLNWTEKSDYRVLLNTQDNRIDIIVSDKNTIEYQKFESLLRTYLRVGIYDLSLTVV